MHRPMMFTILLLACHSDDKDDTGATSDDTGASGDDTGSDGGLLLWSDAFSDGGTIPVDYTCDGADISPPLSWSGAPAGTGSFVLIMDDPDASDFAHWAIYDIPAAETGLAEGVSPGGSPPAGAQELTNDFGGEGYGGCCPPAEHTYVFSLYAVSATAIGVDNSASFDDLEAAAQADMLGVTALTGQYGG